jgi:hypothetical protein
MKEIVIMEKIKLKKRKLHNEIPLDKPCLEGEYCEFTPDWEYDPSGKTVSCEKCGRLPEQN